MDGCEGTRDDLVSDLEIRAKWRMQMSERHADDERHRRSAEALRVAAREVSALAADDTRLMRLADLYCNASDEAIGQYLSRQNAITSHHGFDEPDATTDGLLSALVAAADEAAGVDPGV